jgi:transposase
MRGDDAICGSLFSYIDLEKRIRSDHPLRVIRTIANAALNSLSGEFQKLYSPLGRESIPPERLMRALLLQAFYSIRSERQLVERIDHDLLFRWFVGLGIEDPVWDATTFTKNRDRLLEGDVATQFLAAVLAQDKVKALLSSEHFSVDGRLLEAWASLKSFPDYALSSAIKAWYKTGTYGCFCRFERWRATRCNFKRGSARPSLLFSTEQSISAGRR